MPETHFNFNRHELMSSAMSRFISQLINSMDSFSGLTNNLYGLYDGYYYQENRILANEAHSNGEIDDFQLTGMLFLFSEVEKWKEDEITEKEAHSINIS